MLQNPRYQALLGVAAVAILAGSARADDPPLARVQKIVLAGPVAKRLDHLGLDAKRSLLFVANMANASLDIVDLKAGKVLKSITDQRGVQGVAYVSDIDRLFVGVGENGLCNIYDGKKYALEKSIELADADNVRYDVRTHRVWVGHAENSLAVIDPKTMNLEADVKLPGQPEAFQIEVRRPRLYLNVPSAKAVVLVDTQKNEVTKTFPLKGAGQNFPLALDAKGHRLFVGCRKPAVVIILDTESGHELGRMAIPKDVDDVFYDAKRGRLYASCGEGFLVVLRERQTDRFETEQRIPTVKLARTCLWDAKAGRLFLAVPREAGEAGPQIWVYKTNP